MIKIIRKNQKVVGVVLGIILMVMFLGNLAPQGSQQNAALLRQVGTLSGAKITQLQLNNANAEWQLLQQLSWVEPNQPDQEPLRLVVVYPGLAIADQINKAQSGHDSTPLYFLLWKEAEQQGIVVTQEELNSVLANNVSPNSEPGVEEAVFHAMEIKRLVESQESVVKISQPYRDYQLALTEQKLTVKVAPMVAASFMNSISEPTETDIQKQYDTFSNQVAASAGRAQSEFGSADDPLGFGYKTPNRVTVEYIGLNFADLVQTAKASKSTEDWYVAAFGEFKANRDDYDSQPVPSTQPASTTQPAAPQKIDDIEQDFALHAPLVLNKLYEDATKALAQNAIKDIREKLSSGYGTYRDAVAGGAAPTGPAEDYLSFNYLSDLADSVHQKYNLTPILGNIRQPKSEPELTQISGIGQSHLGEGNTPISFALYATELYVPWMSQADKSSAKGSLAMAQWQPSAMMADAGNNIYFFRISSAESATVPPLASVKEQVIADWKLAAAYAKAQDAAKALLESANRDGLDKAAEAAHAPLLTTDEFDPYGIATGQAAPEVPPLRLTPDSARTLAATAQQLLSMAPTPSGRRQLLANLYADRTVAVIQFETARPGWDPQTKLLYSQLVAGKLRLDSQTPLEMALFTPDLVKGRVGYVSLETKNQ
jgi:hypothetical protein